MTGTKGSGADDFGIAEALAEWPSPVRSAADWDASAKRVVALLESARSEEGLEDGGLDAGWDDVAVHDDDDALLLPPLPRDPDEPEEHCVSIEPAERRSGSVSPPMPGSAVAAQAEEEEEQEEEEPDDSEIVPPASMLRPSTRPPPVTQAAATSVLPPPFLAGEQPKTRKRVPGAILGGLGLTAVAACVFFVVKAHAPSASGPTSALGSASATAATATASAEVATETASPTVESAAASGEPEVRGSAAPDFQPELARVEEDKSSSQTSKKRMGKGKRRVAPSGKAERAPIVDDSQSVMRIAATPTDSSGDAPQ
ncbi:MAG TPA: hypothetical protein VNO21_04460, partial [Polyangiaceae bacterium]|nr:hypothetical protein [Polyangiaceae bacterium]